MQDSPEKEPEQAPPPKPELLTEPPYAGGTDIHIGPDQEHHLPHEGTHQPKQQPNPLKEAAGTDASPEQA